MHCFPKLVYLIITTLLLTNCAQFRREDRHLLESTHVAAEEAKNEAIRAQYAAGYACEEARKARIEAEHATGTARYTAEEVQKIDERTRHLAPHQPVKKQK